MLGVDFRDSGDGARAFYERWKWWFPSIADPTGDLAASLAVEEIPTTLFLDRRHRIVTRLVGYFGLRDMEYAYRRYIRRVPSAG